MKVNFVVILISAIYFGDFDAQAAEMTITPKLGEAFTLNAGQSAKIKAIVDDVVLECTGFSLANRERGPHVHYNLIINGETTKDFHKTNYDIVIDKSDYKTYATMTVWDPVKKCEQTVDWETGNGLIAKNRDACWTTLARRFNSAELCNRIPRSNNRDYCIEYVSEQLQKSDFCQNVDSPSMYCKYVQAIKNLSIQACTYVDRREYQIKCFKEVTEQLKEGIEICDGIDRVWHRDLCKDILSGKVTY